MFTLTPRQMSILKVIVEEYIETATPVGSEPLERKYNLGVSPATIRNEMSTLVQQGYLRQPHTSAGRVPTALSLRMYVNNMMQENQLSVAEEVGMRERIWDHRQNVDLLLHEACRVLANQLECTCLVAINSGAVYSSGYAYLLSNPEFYDIDVTRQVLSLLDDNVGTLMQIFGHSMSQHSVRLVFGEELQFPFLEPVGMVFADFQLGSQRIGTVGVIGPARFDYRYVIPRVRYFGQLLGELSKDY